MVILGIDPGLANNGIRRDRSRGRKAPRDPVRHADDQGRGADAAASPLDFLGVNQLMDIYQPDDVAFEELFFSKNVTTGINVSQARGAALVAGRNAHGKPVRIYAHADQTGDHGLGRSGQASDTDDGQGAFEHARNCPSG